MVLVWKTSVAQARGEMVSFLLESGQRMWQKKILGCHEKFQHYSHAHAGHGELIRSDSGAIYGGVEGE